LQPVEKMLTSGSAEGIVGMRSFGPRSMVMPSTFRIWGCKIFKHLNSFKLCVVIILALASVIFLGEESYSAQATFSWDANMDRVAGFKVYWGQSSGKYTNEADAGNNRTYTIENLSCRTYFIAVTAYNRRQIQSGFSPEMVIEGLNASAGSNGSIFPAGSFFQTRGASQTFTITPDRDYQVASVLVDGTSVGAVTSYTFSNISASHTISATFATLPRAPINVTATAHNAQTTVSFRLPGSNGGSTITGYTATSNPGGLTGTGVGSPITVSNLINGTAYTFTVTATNNVGTGPASKPSNSVMPATVPDAPTIGAATGGNREATVSFTPPASNGGSAITGYTVTSNPGGIKAKGQRSPITVRGLKNGTAYTFTVTATNKMGTGPASDPSNLVTSQ
jgi:hypothetical protein